MILFIESSKEELLRNLTCSTVRRKMNHQKIQLFKHKLHIWLEKWLELRKLYKILSKIILFILENLILQAYDVWFFFSFCYLCVQMYFLMFWQTSHYSNKKSWTHLLPFMLNCVCTKKSIQINTCVGWLPYL